MPQTREEIAAYNKEYHQKNKEKIAAQKKEYYQKNKEKKATYDNEYRQKNKEKILVQMKEYNQTPAGKRRTTINNWKQHGLIHDDYNQLYDAYLESTNCEKCDIEYGQWRDGTLPCRCMDHCHESGYFRNFLCCRCNLERR